MNSVVTAAVATPTSTKPNRAFKQGNSANTTGSQGTASLFQIFQIGAPKVEGCIQAVIGTPTDTPSERIARRALILSHPHSVRVTASASMSPGQIHGVSPRGVNHRREGRVIALSAPPSPDSLCGGSRDPQPRRYLASAQRALRRLVDPAVSGGSLRLLVLRVSPVVLLSVTRPAR